MPRITAPLLVLMAALSLAGCEDSETRAERHYESALSLLQSGDMERAIVEFRNVFKYNGLHREAREAYAALLLDRGEVAEAYGQYLRLIEQYPDTIGARLVLAEIAIVRNDWEEAERHGRAAYALDEDASRAKAMKAALDYRKAISAEDNAARDAAVAAARAVLDVDPEAQIARRVLIAAFLSGRTPQLAMPEIDAALALEPESLEFHGVKLGLLVRSQDEMRIRDQLQQMANIFPDNQEVQQALVSWYIQRDDLPAAEAYLRTIAQEAEEARAPHVAVVQFLLATQGTEAAQSELEVLISAADNAADLDFYRAHKALMDFDAGRADQAISALEAVLHDAEPSDQTRDIKVSLVGILEETGNTVGARALLEEVLAEDATHVAALKRQAAWLIEADKPGEAIVILRNALDQNPRDPQTLTLMAAAHARDGASELATERLALAVEISGSGVEESLRYARSLLNNGRHEVANRVLTDALRVNPANVRILSTLAETRIAARDWPGTQDVITRLRQIETEQAQDVADNVQVTLMHRQGQSDESVKFLQDLIEQGDGDVSAVAILMPILVSQNKLEEARDYLDARLALSPEDPDLRLFSANLYVLEEDIPRAEAVYRALIEENPDAAPPVQSLYHLLQRQDRAGDAAALLDAALSTENPPLQLRRLRAEELEAAGDIDGAIAIYETAYQQRSGNLLIANNLASLIATHRSDPESLDRAFEVSRRLRGIAVPAFQDTYGWIEYRRGNHEEALVHLEPAAAGLPEDPLVQFHLGMTYVALERVEDARASLNRALELAGDSPLPQFDRARETLGTLPSGQ